ncbi:hypothetical protein H072_977 [Dactylellina haptotyla CBS 200.50]|uniref:Rhodopsin domain-containing protein n=1 Tax=Dactylellina haptotyla (strain CBS 200.50) TaxID=1284197 RepID=S8AQ79_DACHA|nr:hypothetical protein H072_977 [Dactylellina haptotyla CBS 200.50]
MSSSETLDGDSIVAILSASVLIGASSPKYPNLRILDLIRKYSDYILANNYTIKAEDLTKYFGTPPPDAPLLIAALGGEESMAAFLTAVIQVEDIIPHPTSPDIVLPLFIALTAMTSIAVGLRIYSRHLVAGGVKAPDWFTVAGYLMTIAWGVVAILHSRATGHYQAYWDKTWHSLRESYLTYLTLTAFYPWVMMMIKFSLLLFYYEVTPSRYFAVRWAIYGTTFIVVGNTIASFFVTLFSCQPVNYWDHLLYDPCKANLKTALIVFGVIYIVTDVLIWVLPMPLVFQLKLKTRERVLAIITFGIGLVACVASGFRVDAIIKYQNYSSQSSSSLMIDAWTIIELNLALICGCAPAIRALVMYYAPKILDSVATSNLLTKSASDDNQAVENDKSDDGAGEVADESEKPDPQAEVKPA